VGTQFLELSVNKWPAGTTTFVRHNVLADYIQDTAVKTGVHESTLYNTQVKRVVKDGNIWKIETSTWDAATRQPTEKIWVSFLGFWNLSRLIVAGI
jgi:hypothetical protein